MSERGRKAVWDQAAAWFARMQEPESEREVSAFEDWLARDPAHARAYAEMEAINRAVSRVEAPRTLESRRAWQGGWRVALAGAVLAAVVATSVLLTQGFAAPAFAAISNRGAAVRGVRLVDGTKVWLDTGAEIGVKFDDGARAIVVREGRVRITPGSSSRPLEVTAGPVDLQPSRTIDVSYKGTSVLLGALDGPVRVSTGGQKIDDLQPGRATAIGRSGPRFAQVERDWPASRLQFTNATLARIVNLANRQPGPDIVFAEPSIASLTVTGVLDLRDTKRLARKLAAAHGLRLVDNDHRLVLRR